MTGEGATAVEGPDAIDEILTTTRAVRRRLDLTRPVSRELLLECLRIAIQAPSGSNEQNWHFVLVSDAHRKRALADLYRRQREAYLEAPPPDWAPDDPRAQRDAAIEASAIHLTDHYHQVPWLLVPVIEGRLERDAGVMEQAAFWGSILPAFWSFMLAARARGLGTSWTTLHLGFEREAADILGIPFAGFTQAGMSPVAYYTGAGFRPAARLPIETAVHWERWGGADVLA